MTWEQMVVFVVAGMAAMGGGSSCFRWRGLGGALQAAAVGFAGGTDGFACFFGGRGFPSLLELDGEVDGSLALLEEDVL